MSETVGYVRVSTDRQVNDRQHDALREAGIDRVFEDKVTGKRFDRPGLGELLDYTRSGDVVVVHSLDRLGRSTGQVIQTANDLLERGIVLKTLKEGIDYSTPTGRMVAGIFAALAEYERVLINERAAEARAAAKARGQHIGKPKALTPDKVALALRMKASGETMRTICQAVGARRSTLYRYIKEESA